MPPAVGVLVAVGFSSAVATAVVTGVVVGAVVGAATAAMSGGNVLKSALKGALIGGVTAGVFSAASAALAPTVTAGETAAMSGVGGGATIDTAMSTATDGLISGGGFSLAEQAPQIGPTVANAATNSVTSAAANVAEKGLLESAGTSIFGSGAPTAASEGTSKIIGGVGQGLFQGAGNYLSAKDTAAANRELAEFHNATEQNQRATNVPGQFNAQVVKIGAVDWWNKRIDPSVINAPLVGGIANA